MEIIVQLGEVLFRRCRSSEEKLCVRTEILQDYKLEFLCLKPNFEVYYSIGHVDICNILGVAFAVLSVYHGIFRISFKNVI